MSFKNLFQASNLIEISKKARILEKESKNEVEEAVMKTYAAIGDFQEFSYFEKRLQTASNYDLYITAAYFSEY